VVTPLASVLVLLSPLLGAGQPERLHARPTLVAEAPAAAPGQTLWLALHFEINPGWHTYWPGQNDSGFALRAEFETSANVTIGEPVWPAPHRYFPTDGILDHVFEERMIVLVPAVVNGDAKPGDRVSIAADLTWLACEEVCLAEQASVSIEAPIASAAAEPDPRHAKTFAQARARVPQTPEPGDGVKVDVSDQLLRITAMGASRLAFYPLEGARRPRNLIRDGEREGEALEIELRDGDEPIAGVLEVWMEHQAVSRVFNIQWPDGPEADTHDAGS
jgi:thiol:disulfide interchange protein DsbD